MSSTVVVDAPPRWTWADFMSTYRFWALLVFYMVSSTSFFLYSTFVPLFRASQGLSYSEIGVLFGLRNFSGLLALYLAWVATRWRPVPMLLSTGVLQLVGVSLLVIPALASSSTMRSVGAILWGLGYYAVLMAIPAFVADGLGGAASFVLAFGATLTFSRLIQILVPLISTQLIESVNIAILLIAPLLLGILLLLPVKVTLFHGAPPERGRSFPAVRREPVAVALLCLVPFYVLYWFYKVHGEASSLAPSRSLLSPRGAVGIAFVPLMVPIMLTTLIDELNVRGAVLGIRRSHSTWAVFIWSIVLPPVAVALVQSGMNQLMARSETQAAAHKE